VRQTKLACSLVNFRAHYKIDYTFTRSMCRAHAFGCVELVEQHGSTRSTRRARLARHAQLKTLRFFCC